MQNNSGDINFEEFLHWYSSDQRLKLMEVGLLPAISRQQSSFVASLQHKTGAAHGKLFRDASSGHLLKNRVAKPLATRPRAGSNASIASVESNSVASPRAVETSTAFAGTEGHECEQCVSLRKRIDELLAEIEKLKGERKTLRVQSSELREKSERVSSQLENAGSESEKLKQELADIKKERKMLSEKVEKLEATKEEGEKASSTSFSLRQSAMILYVRFALNSHSYPPRSANRSCQRSCWPAKNAQSSSRQSTIPRAQNLKTCAKRLTCGSKRLGLVIAPHKLLFHL